MTSGSLETETSEPAFFLIGNIASRSDASGPTGPHASSVRVLRYQLKTLNALAFEQPPAPFYAPVLADSEASSGVLARFRSEFVFILAARSGLADVRVIVN